MERQRKGRQVESKTKKVKVGTNKKERRDKEDE